MKLYDIDAEIEALSEKINQYAEEHEGEIPENLDAELEAMKISREEKIGNIARLVKNCDSYAESITDEIVKLKVKLQSAEKKAESARNFLAFAVGEGNKFKDAVTSIYWSKHESIVCKRPESLPEQYREIKYIADKKALKEAIKSGIVIDGVSIVTNNSLVVR